MWTCGNTTLGSSSTSPSSASPTSQIAKHCRMGPCTAVIQASPNRCLPVGAVLVLDGELKNLTFRLPIRCIKKSKVPQPFAGF